MLGGLGPLLCPAGRICGTRSLTKSLAVPVLLRSARSSVLGGIEFMAPGQAFRQASQRPGTAK
jgi:hypothetical protein